MIRHISVLVVLAGVAAPASGDVFEDITIRLAAEPAAVRPGEEFTLSIFTDTPWDVGVHIPRYFDSIGPFTIVEGYQAKPAPYAPRRRSHATYRLQAPSETGSFEIEGMTAYAQLVRLRQPGDCARGPDRELVTVPGAGSPFDECKESDTIRINRVMQGDRYEATAPPLVVVVYEHVPPDASTMEPRAIAGPVLLPPPATLPVWPWVLAGLVVVLLAGIALFAVRRSSPAATAADTESETSEAVIPAGVAAVAALARLREALAAMAQPSPTAPVEIAEVLRTYIERRLGLPAPRRTTEETVLHLPTFTATTGLRSVELRRHAEEALAICDLAKFAGRAATRGDVESAIGAAEQFVAASPEQSP